MDYTWQVEKAKLYDQKFSKAFRAKGFYWRLCYKYDSSLENPLPIYLHIERESLEMMHVRKIQDEILNLACPRCKTVFVDFDACFALKCRQCLCAFCAWCLQDC